VGSSTFDFMTLHDAFFVPVSRLSQVPSLKQSPDTLETRKKKEKEKKMYLNRLGREMTSGDSLDPRTTISFFFPLLHVRASCSIFPRSSPFLVLVCIHTILTRSLVERIRPEASTRSSHSGNRSLQLDRERATRFQA